MNEEEALKAVTMEELCHSFSHITELAIPPGSEVSYVDPPYHRNIGDVLIFLGTMEFFKRNKIKVTKVLTEWDFTKKHVRDVVKNDIIVCHGGGNFGDIYPIHQELRAEMIKNAPSKSIVIMPQSIHFDSSDVLKETQDLYSTHKNVKIFLRDKNSYNISKEKFAGSSWVSQDMAHSLYDWLSPVRNSRPRNSDDEERTLYFLRADKEKSSNQSFLSKEALEQALDWKTILTNKEKIIFEMFMKTANMAKVLPSFPVSHLYLYEKVCRKLVLGIAERFVKYDHVVTSRLHGTIFSLLLGRKVTLIDNYYGKNSRYANLWLKDIEELTIVKSDERQV